MTVPINQLGFNNSLWSSSHEPESATLEKTKHEKDSDIPPQHASVGSKAGEEIGQKDKGNRE